MKALWNAITGKSGLEFELHVVMTYEFPFLWFHLHVEPYEEE
jgi:hypothetical protein